MTEWRPGLWEVIDHKLLLSGWGWYTDERVLKRVPFSHARAHGKGTRMGKGALTRPQVCGYLDPQIAPCRIGRRNPVDYEHRSLGFVKGTDGLSHPEVPRRTPSPGVVNDSL